LTLAAIAKDRGGRKQMLREYLQAVWYDQAWTPPAMEAQQPWMTLGWLGISNRICKQFAAAFGIVSFQ
jgi:hypothetical protein